MYYTVFDTRFGWVVVVGAEKGLRQLSLPQSTRDEALKLVGDVVSQSIEKETFFSDLVSRLRRYFEGKPVDFPDDLDLTSSTPLQQDVWRLIRSIPYGKTRTYGWISRELGRPKNARWVGQALARNPLPIIIPCHRVIAAGSLLGGFSGGLEMKRKLLELESSANAACQKTR